MSFWSAIVLIVAIVAAASVLRARREDGERLGKGEAGERIGADGTERLREEYERAQQEITELKDRIAVLERLATDANSSEARERQRIEAEIEALRDETDAPLDDLSDDLSGESTKDGAGR